MPSRRAFLVGSGAAAALCVLPAPVLARPAREPNPYLRAFARMPFSWTGLPFSADERDALRARALALTCAPATEQTLDLLRRTLHPHQSRIVAQSLRQFAAAMPHRPDRLLLDDLAKRTDRCGATAEMRHELDAFRLKGSPDVEVEEGLRDLKLAYLMQSDGTYHICSGNIHWNCYLALRNVGQTIDPYAYRTLLGWHRYYLTAYGALGFTLSPRRGGPGRARQVQGGRITSPL